MPLTGIIGDVLYVAADGYTITRDQQLAHWSQGLVTSSSRLGIRR